MNLDELRKYCLRKKYVSETFPFDEDTLVFKVVSKMFCLTNISDASTVNLKCDPELASELRDRYDGITPGYHMNKTHWNTVALDGSVPHKEILEMIDHSYNLVYQSLPKKIRAELEFKQKQ
jgi:predicted DNA-binding protein (MmcQ/YjbR family)